MGFEIRLTKRAEEDLNEIFAYIAQDNLEAAERFAQKLLKRTESPGLSESGQDLPKATQDPSSG